MTKKLDSPAFLKESFPQFDMGEGSYGDLLVFDWEEGTTLKVGKYSSFAFGVKILLGGEHRMDWVSMYPFSTIWPEAQEIAGHPRSNGDVTIGSDVWIGAEAMILSGVKIGDGAVIGARSVVAKDVPAYSIAAGSPAKVLDYRFAPSIIEELLVLKWWDWPREKIVKALPDLLNHEIADFICSAKAGKYD